MQHLLNKIHHADCLEFLRQLPDKCIDLVLTDPPYGIGAANQSLGLRKEHKHCRKWQKKSWDSEAPTNELFAEIFRISKNQIIWGGNYFELGATKFFMIWDKMITGDVPFADCEMAWTSFNKAPKIFRYAIQSAGEDRTHPTQKPLQLFKWCLSQAGLETGIVLDCFSGSGTTALACHDLGLDFICVEKDFEYWKASCERLVKHQRQLKLL
jgi:site-specific DNA-methyltransferase (adenine-specific)